MSVCLPASSAAHRPFRKGHSGPPEENTLVRALHSIYPKLRYQFTGGGGYRLRKVQFGVAEQGRQQHQLGVSCSHTMLSRVLDPEQQLLPVHITEVWVVDRGTSCGQTYL